MRSRVAVFAVVAVVAVVAATALGLALAAALPLTSPPRAIAQFGYVRSLVPRGTGYELRFDPALWLTGQTANRAAIEDGVIPPGEIVSNDYYIRNETRKQLTYRVPRTASVTVLTFGPRSTRIPVSELAAIVKGRNPRGRRLMDRGGHLGYWATVRIDTVISLDQQYQP